MKKDDALALRERLAAAAALAAEKAGATLADDGKLFHDEVDDTARWALRMAAPAWPHRYDAPGLRLEIWFFAGKAKPDEEVLLLAVNTGEAPTDAAFKELETGGKFARRYKALEPMVKRFYPGATGICRRAPVAYAKLEAAWLQLVGDALKPLTAAVEAWDPGGDRRAEAAQADAPDPMEALRKKFGK